LEIKQNRDYTLTHTISRVSTKISREPTLMQGCSNRDNGWKL